MSESFQYYIMSDKETAMQRELIEVFRKMSNSKKAELEEKIKYLLNMLYIHNQNYYELNNHIHQFQDNEFLKKLYDNNKLLRIETHQKTSRYLFNYLSSGISLYDHTKHYLDEYDKNNTFVIKAEELRHILFPEGVDKFTKKLRHHLVHISIIDIELEPDIDDINDFFSKKNIVLNLNDKTRYKKFWKNTEIVKYINDNYSLKGIDLKKICDDYYNRICNYVNWFFPALKENHKSEYEEYERLKTQYDTYYEKYSNYINEHNLTQESKE